MILLLDYLLQMWVQQILLTQVVIPMNHRLLMSSMRLFCLAISMEMGSALPLTKRKQPPRLCQLTWTQTRVYQSQCLTSLTRKLRQHLKEPLQSMVKLVSNGKVSNSVRPYYCNYLRRFLSFNKVCWLFPISDVRVNQLIPLIAPVVNKPRIDAIYIRSYHLSVVSRGLRAFSDFLLSSSFRLNAWAFDWNPVRLSSGSMTETLQL